LAFRVFVQGLVANNPDQNPPFVKGDLGGFLNFLDVIADNCQWFLQGWIGYGLS